jgi:ECF sigma factor
VKSYRSFSINVGTFRRGRKLKASTSGGTGVANPLVYQELRKIAHGYKRGGGAARLTLDEIPDPASARGGELVAVDQALDALAKFDPRKAKVVELRFFGGLSVGETAAVLDISPQSVMRDWRPLLAPPRISWVGLLVGNCVPDFGTLSSIAVELVSQSALETADTKNDDRGTAGDFMGRISLAGTAVLHGLRGRLEDGRGFRHGAHGNHRYVHFACQRAAADPSCRKYTRLYLAYATFINSVTSANCREITYT